MQFQVQVTFNMPPLPNPLEENFCQHYVRNGNRRLSIRLAGYRAPTNVAQYHYSFILLQRDDVLQRIKEIQEARAQRFMVTQDRWLQEVAAIAFCDVADFYDEDGQPKKIDELPKEARAAIQAIEVEEIYVGTGENRVNVGRVRRFKLWDKLQAQAMLGKAQGYYHDNERDLSGSRDHQASIGDLRQVLLTRAAGLLGTTRQISEQPHDERGVE